MFPTLFYILVRAMISSLSHFTIFTLVIAAFSFAIHAYRIPDLFVPAIYDTHSN
ncbi:hypothetical protein LEP1GSC059_0955 [Leptospira noguchii serovar Panama str. CZ214]|uniref:Uncharacterized protein n=1 Tax=Leptospira noguchii serovar Panama str. CZ214 TaxID=1001595 RepID=T0GS52_9LEPT|nr:hypothetical protein LEP1GSC059_0955 [Leptospira noguchii serovar Panama str. CZ214]